MSRANAHSQFIIPRALLPISVRMPLKSPAGSPRKPNELDVRAIGNTHADIGHIHTF